MVMLKRAVAAFALIVLAAGLSAKEPNPEPEPDGSDTKTLQGTWSLLSIELGGKGVGKVGQGLKMTAKITKTELTMERDNPKGGGNVTMKYTIKVNNTKKPAWIDMTSGTRTMPGIYEIKDDKLTLCYASAANGVRPTGFNDPNGRSVVFTFQRVKAKK